MQSKNGEKKFIIIIDYYKKLKRFEKSRFALKVAIECEMSVSYFYVKMRGEKQFKEIELDRILQIVKDEEWKQ